MKIGDKAKVIDWRSVYAGEVVELIEENDKEYVFANAKHNHGTLTVGKNVAHGFIEWEVVQMAENKMAEVAKLFGKKLGEEFKIIHMSVTNKIKFTADGLEMYSGLSKKWIISSGLLEALLTGEAVIVDD